MLYGYMNIIDMFTLTAQRAKSDVYRRQILTTKVNPSAVKVKHEDLQVFVLTLNKWE